MSIWREALAYAPPLAALSMLLASLGQAVHCGWLAGTPRLSEPSRRESRWLLASAGLGLLGVALSVRFPGALLLSLVTTLLGGGAYLRAHQPRPEAPERGFTVPAPARKARVPWLLWLEAGLLIAAAPILLFPTLRPLLAAGAIVLVTGSWVLELVPGRSSLQPNTVRGTLWPRSVYDPALVLFAIAASIAIVLAATQGSAARLLMIPKACSLFLGLATYRLVLRVAQPAPPARPVRPASVGSSDTRSRVLSGLTTVFLLLGLAFAGLGLLGGLRYVRIAAVAPWLSRLPSLVQIVPETQDGRISLNQLGGMLLLVLPLALSLSIAPPHRSVTVALRGLGLLATAALAVALGMTQSRGAWAGAVLALAVILALHSRWGRALTALLALTAAIAWLAWGRATLGPAIAQSITQPGGTASPLGQVSVNGRVPIWTDALIHIRHAPWAGNGLGTYRLSGALLPEGGSPFDTGMPHAHNVLLQVAYDLGLPGLVAYGALLIAALRLAWQIWRYQKGLALAIAIGAMAGLTGYHLYGIMDTLSTGSKPGVLYWFLLALVAAAGQGSRPSAQDPECAPALADDTYA
jgi:O-antigen ligase